MIISLGIRRSVTFVTSDTTSLSFMTGEACVSISTSALAPNMAAVDTAISLTLAAVSSFVVMLKVLMLPSSSAFSAIILAAVPQWNLPTPTTTVSKGDALLATTDCNATTI